MENKLEKAKKLLKEYFKNTPKDVLKEQFEEFNNAKFEGLTVKEYYTLTFGNMEKSQISLNLKPFYIQSIPEHNKYVFIEGVIFGSDLGQLIPSAISFRYQLGILSELSEVITINSSEVIGDFMTWFDTNIDTFDKNYYKFKYL